MEQYFVQTDVRKDDYYEVHRSDCTWLPKESLRKSLGEHSTCITALVEAEKLGFKPAEGCDHCSTQCSDGQ